MTSSTKCSSVWGNQKLGGYPRLYHNASKIAEYIPKCDMYCEPFAGLGTVAKHVKAEIKILNDKSEYAYQYLRKHFSTEMIRSLDFEHCIKAYDNPNTFFLFDPPWNNSIYGNNSKAYLDRDYREYYKKLFEMIPDLKGDWIMCGTNDPWRCVLCEHNEYPKMEITTKNVIFGKDTTVILISNKPFVRYNQKELFN